MDESVGAGRPKSPAVTVLMSVYNGERYLAEAIESVLTQTFSEYEFLIINDGSTDRTREIIHSYKDDRIRLVDNPCNVGLTRSLNRGLELAQASLIARHDADDISLPRRLEKQVEFMRLNPEVVLVGTQRNFINAQGRMLRGVIHRKAITRPGIEWQLMMDNPFIHGSVMFRRDAIWDQLGGYFNGIAKRQDCELWSRVVPKYRVVNLPDVLVHFRVHPASTSANYDRADSRINLNTFLKNIQYVFQCEDVPPEMAEYIVWKNNPAHIDLAGKPGKLEDIFRQIWEMFLRKYPSALHHADVRMAVAADLCKASLSLASYDRTASFRMYRWAFRTHAFLAMSAFFRLVPLLIIGEDRCRTIKNSFSFGRQ